MWDSNIKIPRERGRGESVWRKTEGEKEMEDQKAKDNCLNLGSPVKILS